MPIFQYLSGAFASPVSLRRAGRAPCAGASRIHPWRGLGPGVCRRAGCRGSRNPGRDQRHPAVRNRRHWTLQLSGAAAGATGVVVEHAGTRPFVARAELAMNQEFWLQVPLQLGAGDPGSGRDGAVHAGRSRHARAAHLHRRAADHRAAARRPQLPRARAAGARRRSAAAGIGKLEPRRFRAVDQRRPRGLQRLPARRRLQHRSEAEHAGRPAAGRRHPRVPGVHVDLRRLVRAERRRTDQRDHQVRARTASRARRTSSSATARSTPRNHFAPTTSRRPTTTATSSAARSAGRLAANRTFFFADYERTHLREGITRVTNVPTARRAQRRLLADAVPPAGQFPDPGSRFRAASFPRLSRARSAAPSPRCIRFPIAARRSRTTCRRRRGATTWIRPTCASTIAPGRRAADGALQLQRSASVRAVRRPGLRARSRVRHRRAAARAEPRASRSLTRHGDRARQRRALRLQPRVHRRVRREHRRSTTLGRAEAVRLESARCRAERHSVAGYSPLGHEYTTPQASTSDTFQLSDTATLVARASSHQGGRRVVRHSPVRVPRRAVARVPEFRQPGYTGNALADLLLGLPVLTGGARLDNPQNLRASSWSLFAHDDWRAHQSLTISAGLRYDYSRAAGRRGQSRESLRPADRATRAGGLPARCRAAATSRIGTTSRPAPASRGPSTRRRRTSLRGGYGIYYNQGALATSEGLYFNPPYFNLSVYFPGAGVAAHARGSVPRVLSRFHSAVGDRISARSADARGWNTGT